MYHIIWEYNYETFNIKKDNKPQPQISIDGPNIFQITNDNFDGIVILTSEV